MSSQDPNRVVASAMCRECGEPFDITEGERRFLLETFGDAAQLPKRCRHCRRARRHGEAERQDV